MDRPRPVCPLGKQLLAALGPHSEVIKAALLDAVPSFAAWTAAVLCARDQSNPRCLSQGHGRMHRER